MAHVVIENLTKVFAGPKGENLRAVDHISLAVAAGELLVLVGPSGCGKSTTLRMIAGLEEITSGTLTIDGKVMNQVAPKDRDIALVFQNHALYPHLTARENLSFGLKLRHHAKTDIADRVHRAAEILGLKYCLDRLPTELSGGERQRVAVGRAIVREPKAFLFDEPLSNLDPQMRVQMRREISALHQRLKTTMIYVTHDQTEAMALGNRIAVMRSGVIEQIATPLEVYHRPATQFVAGFIGSPPMNFFCGNLVGKGDLLCFQQTKTVEAGLAGFQLRVPAKNLAQLTEHLNKPIVLGLRPEDISETSNGSQAGSDSSVEALVKTVEPLGPETHLYAASGGDAFVAKINTMPMVDEKISLVFDMDRAHFFDAESGRVISAKAN